MIIFWDSNIATSGYWCFGLSFGPIATISQILNCRGLKKREVIEAFLLPFFPANAIPNNSPPNINVIIHRKFSCMINVTHYKKITIWRYSIPCSNCTFVNYILFWCEISVNNSFLGVLIFNNVELIFKEFPLIADYLLSV